MSQKQRQYLADIIGDSYKQWTPNSVKFITSPTGSGKTYFVFHFLLPFAHSQRKRILYLVNRTSLKKQLQNELKNFLIENPNYSNSNLENSLVIKSYQEFEYEILTNNHAFIYYQTNFHYIIADESHYFYSDSLFNTKTFVSLDSLMQFYTGKITIFISATLKHYIPHIKQAYHFYRNYLQSKSGNHVATFGFEEISLDCDYSYINLYTLADQTELVHAIEEVVKNKQKFICFIDDIKKGNELNNRLKESDIQVPLHISRYHKEFDTEEELQDLEKRSMFKEPGIICTSALDNGINIKDPAITTLFIPSLDYEEILQMIGRKRVMESEILNVYIIKQKPSSYSEKYQYYTNMIDSFNKTSTVSPEEFHNVCSNLLYSPNNPHSRYYKNFLFHDQFNLFFPPTNFNDLLGYVPLVINYTDTKTINWGSGGNMFPNLTPDTYNNCDTSSINQNITSQTSEDKKMEIYYERQIVYKKNPLSLYRMHQLRHFYKELYSTYSSTKNDPYIYHLCEWLNIKHSEVRPYMSYTNQILLEIQKKLAPYVNSENEISATDFHTLFNEYKDFINNELEQGNAIKSTDNVSKNKLHEVLLLHPDFPYSIISGTKQHSYKVIEKECQDNETHTINDNNLATDNNSIIEVTESMDDLMKNPVDVKIDVKSPFH